MEVRLFEMGRVHSQFKQASGTPIQPYRAGNSPGCATLRPEFAPGLEDLAGFDRIWLIPCNAAVGSIQCRTNQSSPMSALSAKKLNPDLTFCDSNQPYDHS